MGFRYTFQRPLIQNDILEATRFAGGLKNHGMLEVNGEQDSLRFNLERKNELQVFGMGAQPRAKQGIQEIPAPKATTRSAPTYGGRGSKY